MGQSDDMRVARGRLPHLRRGHQDPQATAQIFRHRVTSYLELDQRASQVADGRNYARVPPQHPGLAISVKTPISILNCCSAR